MTKNKAIIYLGIYLFGMLYLSLIIQKMVSSSNTFLFSLLSIIKLLLLIGVMYFINKKEINKMFKDYKKNWLKYLKKTIWIWLIGFGLMLLSNYLIQKFGITSPTNETLVRLQIKNFFVYSIISTCLLGPILEELTFRLGFNNIENKYIYLIVTSLLFAFIHISGMNELIYLISYGILGLTYGITYLRCNNIFASIVIHIIHNSITFILLLIL
jgi:uncharacterized protein